MPRLPETEPRRGLIDVSEVAQLLGVQVRHVRRLVQERRIPYVKWGHLIRFDPVDVATWIDTNRRPAGYVAQPTAGPRASTPGRSSGSSAHS
jgi:excisionase family DNA binding protein